MPDVSGYGCNRWFKKPQLPEKPADLPVEVKNWLDECESGQKSPESSQPGESTQTQAAPVTPWLSRWTGTDPKTSGET